MVVHLKPNPDYEAYLLWKILRNENLVRVDPCILYSSILIFQHGNKVGIYKYETWVFTIRTFCMAMVGYYWDSQNLVIYMLFSLHSGVQVN